MFPPLIGEIAPFYPPPPATLYGVDAEYVDTPRVPLTHVYPPAVGFIRRDRSALPVRAVFVTFRRDALANNVPAHDEPHAASRPPRI